MVPYLTALVPDALVAHIPQTDASAPGSDTVNTKLGWYLISHNLWNENKPLQRRIQF